MKNENKPQHTQGEWKVKPIFTMRGKKVIYYRLSNDIDVIGSIGGSKNYNDPTAKADAERIVKAVNLLSLIEKQIEINKAFGNEEKSKVILAEAIEKIINQH